MSDKSALARRLAERLRSEYAAEEAFWNKHRRGSGQIAINLLAEAANAIDFLLAAAEERERMRDVLDHAFEALHAGGGPDI